jgi:hypothetical protein
VHITRPTAALTDSHMNCAQCCSMVRHVCLTGTMSASRGREQFWHSWNSSGGKGVLVLPANGIVPHALLGVVGAMH